ncbi:DUF1878 family protein [Peribacillus muralis]|uniref:DUF1878 family protein n=1 Tax=Peribacillus muralis TaxID=264697 RepID=UPI001F4EF97A|nr:DUF1878 family protein [Peribacillus muralis]MCK1994933.1 YhaI family protein [Peribacillus muralis]MCK2015521.1 YhaI family protein [Peribacillus muralis]
MDNMLDELNKVKYHQKLLLTIALDNNPEQYTYFHFIMNHDLSEKDSKVIFHLLHALEDKREGIYQKDKYEAGIASLLGDNPSVSIDTIEKALLHVNLDVNPVYLIKSMRDQYILVDLCNYLLQELK